MVLRPPCPGPCPESAHAEASPCQLSGRKPQAAAEVPARAAHAGLIPTPRVWAAPRNVVRVIPGIGLRYMAKKIRHSSKYCDLKTVLADWRGSPPVALKK